MYTSMRKISYFICILWMAYTNCTSQAFQPLSRNPLEGSREKFPGCNKLFESGNSCEGKEYVYYEDKDLTKLMDVGAYKANDNSISYVPPLDGTSPVYTLRQDYYGMKFVLFDLQLIDLKSVDPVGGSFRAELQVILHWVDAIIKGSDGTRFTDDCAFPCDTNSPRPVCCDKVWVPPLHLPGCDINKVQSSTPTPFVNTPFEKNISSYDDCFKTENEGRCIWRRLWYLNIDATCATQMDFHNFPFDLQSLTIDILNPYPSRTWFQLTKGFLQDNIGEEISNLNLSPDKNIPGWYVKELRLSSTCGTSENWKQTFLTQDSLLRGLNISYETQQNDINKALSPDTLIFPKMEDFKYSTAENKDFTSPTNYDVYKTVRENYSERVKSTIEKYKQCIKEVDNSKKTYWNMGAYDNFSMTNFEYFSTSSENIYRSFSALELTSNNTWAKVSFNCTITAIANLTTPGIRVTILLQRYRTFYVVKLILPTIACVALAFAAVGLHPKDLVGRLTVVVPSAIALTALQALVVATDIPPLAYIAPTTYIFLCSYLAQILISFESILVSCLCYQKGPIWRQNWLTRGRKQRVSNAPITNATPNESYYRNSKEENTLSSEIDPTTSTTKEVELWSPNIERGSTTGTKKRPNELISDLDSRNEEDPHGQIRVFDILAMVFLATLYIMAILLCTVLPWQRSERLEKSTFNSDSVTLWT